MRKKYLLLVIIALFSFGIINTYAEGNEYTFGDGDIEIYEYGDTSDAIEIDGTEGADTVIDNSEYNYKNEETNYTAIIEDNANLLTAEERAKLFEEMKPLTKYGHTAFVSTDNNTSSVETFADSYYHSHYGTESGSIFMIDMSNRKIYIFSDGENYKHITSSKAYSITDNTYRYATNEDYYGCASLAFKQINTILDGGKIAEPMRYTSNIFIALTLALFFSFVYILGKSKMAKATDRTIVEGCTIDFKIGDTSAIKTGQHAVYSPPSSSGGGSGGGGGGGSSGGGGGHSF